MTSARIEVEKFDGRGDYTMWKEKLMAHLDILGLSVALKEVVETEAVTDPSAETKQTDEEAKVSAEKLEALDEKRRKARSTIVLSVTDRVLRKIKKEQTAAAMIGALDKLYMSKALPNRIYLKQKLYGFKMSENLSIEGNIDEFLQIITDLENTNVQVSDEDQAILLLMSLPKPFDQLRDTLKYGTGRSILTLDEVIAAIYSKELEFGSTKKSIKGQAEGLYAKAKSESRGRSEGREKGNKSQRSRSKSRSKKGCWNCGEEGHFKATCPNKNKGQARPKGELSGGTGNIAEAAGLYVSEALSSTDVHLEDEWVMDTGCSYHMTHKKEWFEDLNEEAGGSVRMGNQTVARVRGVGTVRVKNEAGLSVLLTNVRYIPEMDRNLLSLGTMEKDGYKFESENGILTIKAGDQILLTGRRYDTLYLLQWRPATREALTVRQDDIVLWHRRLGHMSMKNMTIMLKKGFLDRKKVSSMEPCEDCIYGRARRVGFNLAQHDTKDKLEYVHSDL